MKSLKVTNLSNFTAQVKGHMGAVRLRTIKKRRKRMRKREKNKVPFEEGRE